MSEAKGVKIRRDGEIGKIHKIPLWKCSWKDGTKWQEAEASVLQEQRAECPRPERLTQVGT